MAFELRYVNVFDDINSSNQTDIQGFYSQADLKIEGNIPSPSFEESQELSRSLLILRGMTQVDVANHIVNYIHIGNEVAQILAAGVVSELKLLVPSEAALKSAYSKIAFLWKTIFNGALVGFKNVYISAPLGKYELYAVYALSKLSNNIVLIDFSYNKENYKIYNNFNQTIYGTKEHLTPKAKPKITLEQLIENVSQDAINIPSAKIIVTGEDSEGKLNNFLIELNKKQSKICVFTEGIAKPTFDEINKIPRPNAQDTQQLIKKIGVHMFGRGKNDNYVSQAVDYCKSTFESESNCNRAISRLLEFISYFNRIDLNSDGYLVYSKINVQEAVLIDFMYTLGKVIIVVDSNKETSINLSDWAEIDLENKVAYHRYPVIAKSNTVTYNASREIDQVMYNGNTLGLYRDRQFKTCNITVLNTTFDELLILWKQDNMVKPSFVSNDNEVTVPVFYAALKGTCEDYMLKIRQLVTDHSIICYRPSDVTAEWTNKMEIRHGVCVNGTTFKEQKPMVVNGKLDIEAIRGYKNFSYNFLDIDVQYHILSKLSLILEQDLINHSNMKYDEFVDILLNTGLNLSNKIIQYIQWYDYTKVSPKLVILCTGQEVMTLEQNIVMCLLHLCGWDVVVVIPTCYNVIGNIQPGTMQEFNLGEPKFDLNIYELTPYTPKTPKKGLFSKLFG